MEPESDEGIIVVSDVHLGSDGAHYDKFCDFLRWINTFPTNPVKIQCKEGGDFQFQETEISFVSLSRLILLGDIIDMWNPKKQDRINIIAQSFEPLSILHGLKCHKIYVTGNHDEDIGEISRIRSAFSWSNGYEFVFSPRHYPETQVRNVDGKEERRLIGRKIHDMQYICLHGHQFDREQITYTISQIINKRFDPIDTISDLANISMTRMMSGAGLFLIVFLWAIFYGVTYYRPIATDFLQNTATAIFLCAVALSLLMLYPQARTVLSDRKPIWWEGLIIQGIFLGPSLALAVYLAILLCIPGLPWSPAGVFLIPVLFVLSILLIIAVLPRIFGWAQMGIYGIFNVKDKTVDEALKAGYNDDRDTISSDVVIFGHTHRAGHSFRRTGRHAQPGNRQRLKLFVNTGCWVDVSDSRPVNTFVYIDKTGLYLLEWGGPDSINCLFHFSPQQADVFKT